jgi:hypothetical protein
MTSIGCPNSLVWAFWAGSFPQENRLRHKMVSFSLSGLLNFKGANREQDKSTDEILLF